MTEDAELVETDSLVNNVDQRHWEALEEVSNFATEQSGESASRYKKLIYHMPTALLQVDARVTGKIFERLRTEGVTDLAAYMDEHPGLVDLANQVVLVTDVNKAAVTLFEAQKLEDLVGPVRFLFAATPGADARVMDARFRGQRNYSEQIKIKTFRGTVRDILMTVTYPAPPENLDTTFITLLDISDRLRLEDQFRHLQTDFARAARLSTLGELATSIAHEVRQPLSAIVTNGETSLRWLAKDEPNLQKAMELTNRMVANAHRASDILQRIRDMAVKGEAAHQMLDLASVVEESLLFVKHDLETKPVTLRLALTPELPQVRGDRIQLQQVLVNLVVNSIQAITQAGRSHGRIDIQVTPGTNRSTVEVAVVDNGPGIRDDQLDQVFDSFFTTKKDGVGIGLAICQSIIMTHGGRISASHNQTGGATFRFTLPAVE